MTSYTIYSDKTTVTTGGQSRVIYQKDIDNIMVRKDGNHIPFTMDTELDKYSSVVRYKGEVYEGKIIDDNGKKIRMMVGDQLLTTKYDSIQTKYGVNYFHVNWDGNAKLTYDTYDINWEPHLCLTFPSEKELDMGNLTVNAKITNQSETPLEGNVTLVMIDKKDEPMDQMYESKKSRAAPSPSPRPPSQDDEEMYIYELGNTSLTKIGYIPLNSSHVRSSIVDHIMITGRSYEGKPETSALIDAPFYIPASTVTIEIGIVRSTSQSSMKQKGETTLLPLRTSRDSRFTLYHTNEKKQEKKQENEGDPGDLKHELDHDLPGPVEHTVNITFNSTGNNHVLVTLPIRGNSITNCTSGFNQVKLEGYISWLISPGDDIEVRYITLDIK
jgi:hypothetical protein